MGSFLHYLSMPYLLDGILITLQATALGFFGGFALGLLLAGMALSRNRVVSGVARTYSVIFRGTPLVLQLVFVFTALPHAGIVLSPIMAAGVALAANEATFFAEIFRSAVIGVDKGQTDAARAVGLRPGTVLRRIVGPQAARAAIPAIGSEAVSTMKNSALASIIAVPELTLRSNQLASATFDYFSIFFASGVMYLVLTGAITGLQLAIERTFDLSRVGKRGRGRPSEASTAPVEGTAPAAEPVTAARVNGAQVASAVSRAEAVRRARVALTITGVHKAFAEHEVLRGIDMEIRKGEVVALLGPSGSGKSTLLRLINHLETLDAGTISFDGIEVGYRDGGTALPEREVARQRVQAGVGMVFQHFNLFGHLTARENVAVPLRWVHRVPKDEALAEADRLLGRVGLSARAHALPRQLSGGQQQRVGIARALAGRPQVLLLDEPTSALDPELVQEVLEVVRSLALDEGLTMLIATHQLGFAREVADRVVFMAEGRVLEQGSPQQVLDNPQHPTAVRFLRAVHTVEV
ncbi:amino acid ABC transporter permease/ATP-binding protein [Pseudonocardia xinjiangensis]|uniref:Amino acid ABC transporter permease/ATP-binding protein n=1 Tax=Pseudonocardia xinjiangensis TaxID=75289 RepID=A0ABX1RHC2_9PSEU|nr:amino acid ABC transporter permease/ATP-binding protein [Pseudonocardia xinjiangensis]